MGIPIPIAVMIPVSVAIMVAVPITITVTITVTVGAVTLEGAEIVAEPPSQVIFILSAVKVPSRAIFVSKGHKSLVLTAGRGHIRGERGGFTYT